MGSFIQIDSISIDLANSIDKSDVGKCEHFSIRGYVSEIRKKDWKICWPFPLGNLGESEDQPSSFPPLDVPKFRWWCCQNCQREIAAEGGDKDDRTEFNCCSTGCRSASNCSKATLRSDIQVQFPTPNTLERRKIDLNGSTNLSGGNDHLPTNNEKENNSEAADSSRIDHVDGLENDLNHEITSVPPGEVCPGLIPEVPVDDRGSEGNEVFNVELATVNLKCVANNSSEIYNGGTHISEDNQCSKELNKTCTNFGEGIVVAVADNTIHHTTGHPPIDSVALQKALPGVSETLVENDFQDHHLEKSPGLSRRRPRKVRLLTDLLSENIETKTEKFTIQGSPSDGTSNASAAVQAFSIPQGKVDVQGDFTNMGKSRKKKFLLDEEQKPMETCSHRVESEVQNLEGNAEVNDTILETGSKDVHVNSTVGLLTKPEIERSHSMGKKNKKIQVADNHFIAYPYQNEKNKDVVGNAYTSKTLSSRLAPCAFTEKGMDSFPLHAQRTEKECSLSKGKGKMLQVDGELASLSRRKNDVLVEDSFSLTGPTVMSNMPVVVPIPSAQGSIIKKGVEEGLHSLNSYLAAQLYNKKCIHQIENQPPFSLSLQEGTSKVHQHVRKDRENNNLVGKPSITYKHTTDAVSEEGVRCEVSSNKNPLRVLFPNEKHKYASQVEDGVHFCNQQTEITGARNTDKTAEALEQASIMKNNSDQTANKVSEQGTMDDIPMEIVELMAKNQYERRLSNAENISHPPEKSTMRRKTQMTAGTAVCRKGESSLLQEGQKEKPEGRQGKNGVAMRGENVRPGKRKSVHYFSPVDGSHLNMNSLCQPQSSFGFEVSHPQKRPPNGFNFLPVGSSQLGSARNCKLNGRTAEGGSSGATLQAQGGCSLHKTILHQDDEASHIWASLTPNPVSLGYGIPKKVVSHSTSTLMDMTPLQSGALYKQNMNRDDDLINYLSLNATSLEKLNRNIGPGTLSRTNAEYPFPCKHNGIEPHQNMRGSLDLYSNETIPAMHLLSLMDAGMKSGKPFNASISAQMLDRPSYPGDCNSKLQIGTSKALDSRKRPSSDCNNKSYLSDKSHGCFLSSPNLGASSSVQHNEKLIRATNFHSQISSKSGKKEKMKSSNSAMQNRGNKQFNWPCLETETPLQHKSEVHGTCGTLVPLKNSSVSNSCSINRNPADFTMPELGNFYMIRGEDLKFDNAIIPQKRPGFLTLQGCKQQRNLKRTKIK